MSTFGSGYIIISRLLSTASSETTNPTSPPTFDGILEYLRSNNLGGLKYAPDDSRTLTITDAHHILRKFYPDVDIEVIILRPGSSSTINSRSEAWLDSVNRSEVALYDNLTSEWSLPSNVDDILPISTPSTTTTTSISGEEYKALIKIVTLPPPPPLLPEQIRTKFKEIESTICDINSVASKSSTDVESLNLPPEPFIYGDVTLPGVGSILHSLGSKFPSTTLNPESTPFVDLGSGSGLALLAVKLIEPDRPYLGIELLPSLVDVSRTIEELDPESIVQADFLDGSYDWWSSSLHPHPRPKIYFSHCTVVFDPLQLSRLSFLFKKTHPSSVFVAVGNPLPDCEIVHEFLIEVSWGVETGIIQINKSIDNK
ncbi:hypothetical protein TrVE_jg9131 [Triparma verrucosa]|uniref:DOT1 domain-containing protein n=1 Tax=Triparma verrucosa TaxID=1606542 RepID=A0A9W7B8P7_9STRA|nr:hypothetical protein TrVE_jg9131 [Triparma verrucosa]